MQSQEGCEKVKLYSYCGGGGGVGGSVRSTVTTSLSVRRTVVTSLSNKHKPYKRINFLLKITKSTKEIFLGRSFSLQQLRLEQTKRNINKNNNNTSFLKTTFQEQCKVQRKRQLANQIHENMTALCFANHVMTYI